MQEMMVSAPFERVSIDVTGPYPRSSSGKDYIVIMVDHFSKWAEAVPVANREARQLQKLRWNTGLYGGVVQWNG